MIGRWVANSREEVTKKINEETLDITLRYTNIIQDIVIIASRRNKSLKIINLGAGVKRIISDTGICPICKRSLKEEG
jgi:hypothetical protein